MKRLCMSLFILAAASGAASAQDCSYDREAMLAMDQQAFDQSLPDGGWRGLAMRPGCELAAAELIADYRNAHAERLVNGAPGDITILNWHEGQLRAGAGETERAMQLFARSTLSMEDAWGLYARATIAFLARDRAELQRARDALAALPQPEWYAQSAAQFRAQFGQEMIWPMNLDVVDGLIRCFDRPYNEAYGLECRAPASE